MASMKNVMRDPDCQGRFGETARLKVGGGKAWGGWISIVD